jgi:hypothetical protein
MAGFRPDEGETVSLNVLLKRLLTDRDADLEIGLFTNAAPGETITEATLTEPATGGYARKTLTDGSWTESPQGQFNYAAQIFTPAGASWTGIQGYFIATKAAGGTQRILAIEVDPNGPITVNDGNDYQITPQITAT